MMDKELWELYLKVIHDGGIGNIEAWTKLDLTMPQLKILMLLSHHGELSMGELAERLKVSLPNLTGIIERLSHLQLVQKIKSNKDKRVHFLKLTDKANDIFRELYSSGFNRFREIEGTLSSHELEIVKLGLKVLVQGMEKSKP